MSDVLAERGQVLLLKEPARNGLPERYRLWTVASVRTTARGAALRLVSWSPGATMTATATLPGGIVGEPWQLFTLSQRDLAHVYSTRRAELEGAK